MAPSSGIIAMWSGLLANIPIGWSVCDGSLGTPDLREKFIFGATVEAGDTGGTATHTHDFTGDGHSHIFPADNGLRSAPDLDEEVSEENVTGTTDPTAHLPAYFELIFIMKD